MSLTVENVRVERGGREILRGVSLEIARGEVVGILGPSGAGKSTLFRHLSGTQLGSGTVRLGDTELGGLPLWQRARAGLGVMPQEPSVLFDLTVRQNLAAFDGDASTERIEARAADVGLESRLGVRARDLSAGERRRLEFLRATTHAPSVLLCDEPFAGVDPKGALALARLLRALAEAGTSIVLADHHVEEALAICDRALLLLDGQIAVNAASSAEFREHPLVQGRYLGTLHAPAAGTV